MNNIKYIPKNVNTKDIETCHGKTSSTKTFSQLEKELGLKPFKRS